MFGATVRRFVNDPSTGRVIIQECDFAMYVSCQGKAPPNPSTVSPPAVLNKNPILVCNRQPAHHLSAIYHLQRSLASRHASHSFNHFHFSKGSTSTSVMYMLSNFFVLALLALSASASLAGRGHGAAHRRHHIARHNTRSYSCPPKSSPSVVPRTLVNKRGETVRCRQRPQAATSSSVIEPAATSSPVPAPPAPTDTTTYDAQKTTTTDTSNAQQFVQVVQESVATQVQTITSGALTGASNAPSFMYGTQVGQSTFYTTGLGACGITNNDGEYIAAASHELFDHYP